MGAGGAAIAVRGLQKSYETGGVTQAVLTGVDLDVEAGRFVSIMGPSGSGKSTLLHLMAGLDVPDAGEVHIAGTKLSSLTDDQRTDLRRTSIGIVYQFFNLVPVLTVEENIALPAVIAGDKPASYEARLRDVIDLVGLGDQRGKQPSALSGGQQQRAAIARALFIEPDVLLADEPTGNLDLRTGADILRLFTQVQASLGQTIVMVTHDPRSAAHGDEVLLLRDGRVADRLEVVAKARGDARTDRAHPSRSKAVFRWLEDLDATGSVAARSAEA